MLTKKQLDQRKQGIGGSDVGAILGLSKWKTPLDVYMDKTGKSEPSEQTTWQKIGHQVEEHILIPFFEEKYATTVNKLDTKLHKDYSFLLANVDGVALDGKILIECKNVGGYKNTDEWGEAGSDQVPYNYHVQCLHYMEVLNIDECILIALFGGNKIEEFRIKRNKEVYKIILQKLKIFWTQNVLKNVPPEPKNISDMKILFPFAKENSSVQANIETLKNISKIKELQEQKKEIESKIRNREIKLKSFMKDHEILMSTDNVKLASWKNQRRGEKNIRTFRISGNLNI